MSLNLGSEHLKGDNFLIYTKSEFEEITAGVAEVNLATAEVTFLLFPLSKEDCDYIWNFIHNSDFVRELKLSGHEFTALKKYTFSHRHKKFMYSVQFFENEVLFDEFLFLDDWGNLLIQTQEVTELKALQQLIPFITALQEGGLI